MASPSAFGSILRRRSSSLKNSPSTPTRHSAHQGPLPSLSRFDKIILEGYMFKESRTNFGKWNQRYFKLGSRKLSYADKQSEEEPKWEVVLEDIQSVERVGCNHPKFSQALQIRSLDSNALVISSDNPQILWMWEQELVKLTQHNDSFQIDVKVNDLGDFFSEVMNVLTPATAANNTRLQENSFLLGAPKAPLKQSHDEKAMEVIPEHAQNQHALLSGANDEIQASEVDEQAREEVVQEGAQYSNEAPDNQYDNVEVHEGDEDDEDEKETEQSRVLYSHDDVAAVELQEVSQDNDYQYEDWNPDDNNDQEVNEDEFPAGKVVSIEESQPDVLNGDDVEVEQTDDRVSESLPAQEPTSNVAQPDNNSNENDASNAEAVEANPQQEQPGMNALPDRQMQTEIQQSAQKLNDAIINQYNSKASLAPEKDNDSQVSKSLYSVDFDEYS